MQDKGILNQLQSLHGSTKRKSPNYKSYIEEIHKVFSSNGLEIGYTYSSVERYIFGNKIHIRIALKGSDNFTFLIVVKEKENTSSWEISFVKEINEKVIYPQGCQEII